MADKKQGYTLWEKWTGQVGVASKLRLEDKIFNPLKLHHGDIVVSKLPEEEDRKYSMVGVCEYSRRVSGEEFKSTDYLLQDGEKERILRANLRPERDPDDPRECDLLWLEFFDRMEFNEGVREAVTHDEFSIDENDDGKPDITYYELHAGKDGFLTRVRAVKRGENSFKDSQIRYWDFYKKGEPKYNESEGEDVFFFVECDENDGYITMLKGMRVSSRDIEIYPAE